MREEELDVRVADKTAMMPLSDFEKLRQQAFHHNPNDFFRQYAFLYFMMGVATGVLSTLAVSLYYL